MLPLTLPLVFNKPSSQAPAVSLKNSLYAGLHLDPPLAIAVEPHGCSVWRRHREWREVWQASGRGMAFLLSHPEQSEQTRLGKCSGLGWVSGLLSKDVPLQVLGHRSGTKDRALFQRRGLLQEQPDRSPAGWRVHTGSAGEGKWQECLWTRE
jgi:hypothetical protein